MDTKSKFLRFGFGFLLGVFLLLIMFGNRDFSCVGNYFPEGRVLNDIKNKKLIFSVELPVEYSKLTDTAYFRNVFLEEASVQFNQSEPRKEPCGEYWITNDTVALLIKNCREQAEVLKVK